MKSMPPSPASGPRTGQRANRSIKLLAAGAVLGALVALVTIGVPRGKDALLLAVEPSVTAPSQQPLRVPVHTCLTWQRQDATDARPVGCEQPHLFEVTGTLELRDFSTEAPYPNPDRWQKLVAQRCTQLTTQALDDHFDPFGRFTVGAIKPSAAGWVRDRTLRCGVQAAGRSGTLYPITGSAREQDQSDVHPVGTCLGNDGKTVGDPVDCARPHAVEIVGVVDLKDSFRKGFPDEAAQDKVLDKECTRLATNFAGGAAVAAKLGLTLFWETLRAESWRTGSTRVDCRLGAFLPDRSGFAPVTGGVKGPVQVGKQPAPAAPRTPGPASVAPPPVTQVDDPAAPPS